MDIYFLFEIETSNEKKDIFKTKDNILFKEERKL